MSAANHFSGPRDVRARRQANAKLDRADRCCLVADCPRRAKLVALPLSERRIWVCDGHRPGLTIGHMQGLIAHG